MEKQKETKSGRDINAFAVIIGIAALAFLITTTAIETTWRSAFIICILLSFFIGLIGKERKIGFGNAFFASFLLSPLVGFILTLNSPKIKDEEYKEKMLEMAETNTSASVADQLHKLNELRKEGVLTDEEFEQQKEKLLNQ